MAIKSYSNSTDNAEILEVDDTVKKQVVKEAYKKIVTDYVIPNISKLIYDLNNKNIKEIKTIIMKDLCEYLCILISKRSPIKTEIIELLSVDSELMAKIEYDLKQMKNDKHKPSGNNHLGEYDSENDEIYNIEESECVTWAQIMK